MLQKATHQQTKLYNSQFVFKTIYDQGLISRADVARQTRLTRVTVSEIVAELIEKGLVAEVGRGPSTGGKTPILLSVVEDARHLISLDLADDVFRGAVINLSGKIVFLKEMPRQGCDGDQALELVYRLIDELLAATDRPLLGIGVGTPGLVDTENGIIFWAVNLDWHNLPLGSLLNERYDLPVYVANDSQVAALAEHIFGTCTDDNNLVAIKVGRGIGSGIVMNGRLYQGDGFGAGEIGHVRVVSDGKACRCGNHGCLETVASHPALIARVLELLPAFPESTLREYLPHPQDLTLPVIQQAVEAGDPAARQTIQEAGHNLGIAIASIISVLNIQHILVLGEVNIFGQEWLEIVRETAFQSVLPALGRSSSIEYGCLGADDVLLGASALLLTHELGLSLARYAGSSLEGGQR